jgi:tagatose-1,6-bisphosphate aldolase non-catalytic subunit AgaZ/GatZ
VCRKQRLTRVNYVYGDHLGPTSGQAKTEAELARMDAMQEEFTVYEVEVCRGCGWNHLDASYVLGAEPVPGRQPRRGRRRVATE